MTAWSNEKIINFIKEVRLHPELWDIDSVPYRDRNAKRDAWKKVAALFNIPVDEACKKFKNLRTYAKNEFRKKKSASTDNKSSKWFAYDAISYLLDRDIQDPGTDSETTAENFAGIEPVTLFDTSRPSSSSSSHVENQASRLDGIQRSAHPNRYLHEDDDDRMRNPRTLAKKRNKTNNHSYEKLMELACEKLTDNEDEYYHWAMALAADLRGMERTQQIYAKRAIAEVIMEGQLGRLHRNSVQINETPAYTHSSKSPD